MDVEFNCAMKCVASLISYLDLLSDDANLGAYKLQQFNLNNYMKLDASAVKALNLIPGPKDGKKNNNLFGLLNRCKTAQGSRLLGQWIKQPLMDVEAIKTRQDLVQIFFDDSLLRQNIQEISLKAFPDLHRLAKKFQRGKAGLQDVIRIYQVVKNLPGLVSNLQEYKGEHLELINEKFVSKLQRIIESLVKLEELVETTIDLEASDNHEFIIKPDYDTSLQEVRGQMDAIFSQLKPEARRVAEEVGVEFEKKLKFENNPQYGYHMRLSRNDASKIRGTHLCDIQEIMLILSSRL
jgi:DNA mismatch repair protein MSH2